MKQEQFSENEYLAIIEGLLFLFGNEGITSELLCTYLKLEKQKTKVEKLIINLQKKLNNDEASGLAVVKHGNIYKLTTKTHHAPFYQGVQAQTVMKLSQAALETLAIISYNQPVTKPRIEEIRGVNCDGIINKLIVMNLITEIGKSDLPGRPYLYVTTDKFMDQFQISSLAELPDLPNYSLTEEEQEIYNYSND